MGARQVKIIVRPVEIRRHAGDKVGTVLSVVALAHLDTSNLGYSVRFIA